MTLFPAHTHGVSFQRAFQFLKEFPQDEAAGSAAAAAAAFFFFFLSSRSFLVNKVLYSSFLELASDLTLSLGIMGC